MNLENSTALVTGANRGLGREFARQLRDLGATVFATARNPDAIDLDGVQRLRLDITDPADVAAAAAAAPGVDLLVNNAGVSTRHDLITGDPDAVRLELETHFFGTLATIRAFAPVLAAHGGGAIVNVMSALSFQPYLGANAYYAAKTAEWALTNAVRLELSGQGTTVLGAFLASTDTDMMAGYDVPKNDPADVVRAVLDGVRRDATEVVVDEDTRLARAALAASLTDA